MVLCILSAAPLFIAVCLNGPDLLYVGAVSAIYWLTATAAYLLWTFGPWWDAQPQDTWILWAVAGVLYGAVMALVRGIRK